MFHTLLLLFLSLSLSLAGVLDPKLKNLIKLHAQSSDYKIKVKVLTKERKFKILSVPVSQISELTENYLYVEAPRKIFPLNDVAVSESYAVSGSNVVVNASGSFTGYILEGNLTLPQNCQQPYSQLPNYFTCLDYTTFSSTGNLKLILKDVDKNNITASGIYRLGVGASKSGKTGRGVIIGIVDTGINFCHPAFLDENGKTRIKFFGFSTNAANCDGNYDAQLGICEYDENKINTLITQGGCNYDNFGHGTHVTGTAAGYWEGSLFNGVAPNSTLVIYRLSEMSDQDAAMGLYWIKKKAQNSGMPVVVNFSLGTHYGAHDGTSFLSQVIDEVSGEGFIVVTAVGNSGNAPIHAYSIKPTDTIGLRVNIHLDIEGWYKRGSAYRVELCSSSQCLSVNPGQNGESYIAGCYTEIYNSFLSHPLNGDGYFLISISCPSPTDLQIKLTALQGTELRVDMWIANFYQWEGFFLDHYQTEETGGYKFTVTVPATANSAITVGAIGSKPLGYEQDILYLGRVAPFSSRGPTRDGRVRPHVVAAGYYVCSANSDFSQSADKFSCERGKYYIPLAGTSMAAPVVTGLVALYLQDNPAATPEEVKAWLTTNAVKDVNIQYPNLAYGYGKAVYSVNKNFTLSGESVIPIETGNFASTGSGGGGCNSFNLTLPGLIGFLSIRLLLLSLWKRLR